MDKDPKIMADIYPVQKRPELKLFRSPQPLPPEPPRRFRKSIVRVAIFFVLIFVVFYGTRTFALKSEAQRAKAEVETQIELAKRALVAFNISEAEGAFVRIKEIALDINRELNRFGYLHLAEIAGLVYPPAAEAPHAVNILDRLASHVLAIIRNAENLKAQAFSWMSNGQGKTLINELSRLESDVAQLGEVLEEMKATAAELSYPVGDDVLAFRSELYRSEALLDAAIKWLSGTNHIALMFVNPSEIRPGGGFPGSYAAITISRGNLGKIEVRDIYDPDGQLATHITPPKPLRLITSSWGARDANWFFDFPTSARKTLSLLNDSRMYSEQKLSFDGLLAINVHAVSELLDVIGEVEVPEHNLVLTSSNFLDEIQREVRSGDGRTTGDPKRVLKTLTPILLERIAELDESGKKKLIEIIRRRFLAKDMLAYLEDVTMQPYLETLGISGAVDQLDDDADLNEYLAVVNANVAGGKSDAVMSQRIDMQSRIDLEGRISNEVTIRRSHGAKANAPSWYNITNKNFLQILTPRGSDAISARGGDASPAIPEPATKEHRTDPDLQAIEGSTEYLDDIGIYQSLAFNKSVFSTWLNVAPRTSRSFTLRYVNPQRLSTKALARYRFVYEKQPGVETALNFSIDAPPEYKWKESNTTTYTFTTESAPGKLVIELTLVPMR